MGRIIGWLLVVVLVGFCVLDMKACYDGPVVAVSPVVADVSLVDLRKAVQDARHRHGKAYYKKREAWERCNEYRILNPQEKVEIARR